MKTEALDKCCNIKQRDFTEGKERLWRSKNDEEVFLATTGDPDAYFKVSYFEWFKALTLAQTNCLLATEPEDVQSELCRRPFRLSLLAF